MQKPLLGKKIAVLVANGFSEKDFTTVQKKILPLGADMRIVSMDNGLITSWNGEGWGLNFASDNVLSEALAADYSMLLVPGGRRSVEKLKLTAHTRRFVNGFLNMNKSVVLFEEAVELLAFAEQHMNYEASAPADVKELLEQQGANVCDESITIDRNLLTGRSDDETRETLCDVIPEFLIEEDTAMPESVAA